MSEVNLLSELLHSTSVLRALNTQPMLLNKIIFNVWSHSTEPPPPFAATPLALASSVDGALLNAVSTIYKAASLLKWKRHSSRLGMKGTILS